MGRAAAAAAPASILIDRKVVIERHDPFATVDNLCGPGNILLHIDTASQHDFPFERLNGDREFPER